MAISQPPLPAVPDYPCKCPFEDAIEAAHERFVRELNSHEDGWQEVGDKDGVRLSKKWDEQDKNPLPLCKGETFVEDVTPEAFLAGVIQLPGMRSLWDPRTEVGYMMERYERNTVLFYALTKGKKFIARPRDLVGIQRNYADADGSRMIIQTSVDSTAVPEQSGTTRATLKLSGWWFKPEGSGIRVVYILDVALNGSIPKAIVSMATSESPLCAGRAREIYYKHGHAPYVHSDSPTEPSIIFQLESITAPPQRDYHCTITTGSQVGEAFEILYDRKRMYPDGVQVSIEGDGGVDVQDDGQGVVRVTTTESGKTTTVAISPK